MKILHGQEQLHLNHYNTGKRLLIIDDEAFNVDAILQLLKLLKLKNCEVDTAYSA